MASQLRILLSDPAFLEAIKKTNAIAPAGTVALPTKPVVHTTAQQSGVAQAPTTSEMSPKPLGLAGGLDRVHSKPADLVESSNGSPKRDPFSFSKKSAGSFGVKTTLVPVNDDDPRLAKNVELPSKWDPIATIIGGHKPMKVSEVRASPSYIDNGIKTIQAEVTNPFELSIETMQLIYSNGRTTKVALDLVDMVDHVPRTDVFVEEDGFFKPVDKNLAVMFDPENTPNIVKSVELLYQERKRVSDKRLELAQLVVDFGGPGGPLGAAGGAIGTEHAVQQLPHVSGSRGGNPLPRTGGTRRSTGGGSGEPTGGSRGTSGGGSQKRTGGGSGGGDESTPVSMHLDDPHSTTSGGGSGKRTGSGGQTGHDASGTPTGGGSRKPTGGGRGSGEPTGGSGESGGGGSEGRPPAGRPPVSPTERAAQIQAELNDLTEVRQATQAELDNANRAANDVINKAQNNPARTRDYPPDYGRHPEETRSRLREIREDPALRDTEAGRDAEGLLGEIDRLEEIQGNIRTRVNDLTEERLRLRRRN